MSFLQAKKRFGRLSKQIDREKLRNLAEIYKRNIEKELGMKLPEKKIESRRAEFSSKKTARKNTKKTLN